MLARFRAHLLIAIALAMTLALAAHAPIPQPLAYHAFADTRTLFGIPNFWNVVSNLPFVLVGLAGLYWALKHLESIERVLQPAWLLLFFGVTLVGLGSSWYHLQPTNASLVWDRLPMTLAFMAFFAIVLGEHIDQRLARLGLWPLLAAGALSVLYWRATDDLRPYALVQFLPVLLIPLILLLYPRRAAAAVWLALTCYVVAKGLEQFDAQVYTAFAGRISGHSLKHVAAAAGMAALLAGLRARVGRSGSIQTGAPIPD